MNKLLTEDVSKQIKEYLQQMNQPITFVLFIKEKNCETCPQTKMLLEEISALNEKISLEVKDIIKDKSLANEYGITLTPSFIILDHERKYKGVKFNGIPAGHEINSFLSAVLDMSGLSFDIDKKLIDRLNKINKKTNMKVFVTLSCPHCPGAVSNAHRLAMLNDNIESEMVEAQTFYDLSRKFNVSGVPKIVINDKIEILGNQPLEEYLNKLESL